MRDPLPLTSPGPRRPAPARRGPKADRAAAVLALQRVAGNAATGRLLARDARADRPTPTFRLLIVDDGETGLSTDTVKQTLDIVSAELVALTKKSDNPVVKAGFAVEHVTHVDAREPRDLGRSTFLVFLTKSTDAEHVIGLAADHVSLSVEDRKTLEKHYKDSVETEGGLNVESANAARRRSTSTSIVSTRKAIEMQAKQGAGAASAAALVGETILHELGHSLGHSTGLGDHDHDPHGIMTKSRVLDSTLRYQASHFSDASAQIIRARLEELAQRLTPR